MICIKPKSNANLLSEKLKENPTLKFYFKQSCKTLPDEPSHNVIGELVGTDFPDKIITVGGHIDSWDLGDGAHDDGAGVVQSIEVLRLFKLNGIKPTNVAFDKKTWKTLYVTMQEKKWVEVVKLPKS